MITEAQRKRKRKQHAETQATIRAQEAILKEIEIDKDRVLKALANDISGVVPIYICNTCGHKAFTKKEVKHTCHICKCCGSTSNFANSKTYVCNSCLGRSVELFGNPVVIKEWSKCAVSFTITKLDGSESTYSSLKEASKDLGYSIPALRDLVLSNTACGGLKATVIPNVKTWEDYEQYKNSKKIIRPKAYNE